MYNYNLIIGIIKLSLKIEYITDNRKARQLNKKKKIE